MVQLDVSPVEIGCPNSIENGTGSEWLIAGHISPGPRLLRTHPDQVSAVTQEEAFAKARAIIDQHLSR